MNILRWIFDKDATFPELRDSSGWPMPDVNGRDVYDVGRIDANIFPLTSKPKGLRPYRVFVGWQETSRTATRTQSRGIVRQAWTLRGANRIADRARRDPRNAETIAREGCGVRIGTVHAGGSFTFDMSVNPPTVGEVTP